MSETLVKIADVCQLGDGAHASVERQIHGVPYLTSKNIGHGHLKLDSVDYISTDDYEKLFPPASASITRLHTGDVLTGIIGTFSNLYLYKDSDSFGISSAIAVLRPDQSAVVPEYLYYYLTSPQFQALKQAVASGSVQGYTNLRVLGSLPIRLPDLSEQRAIAEVLGALDDKIAANTKLAETAHGLLQAAYRGVSTPAGRSPVRVETLVQRLTPSRKFVPGELKSFGDFPVFDQSESGFLGYLDGDDYLDASPDDPVLYFGDHTCQLRISSEKFTVGPNTVPFKGMGIPTLTLYCAISGLQRHEEYKRHWQLLMKKEICLPDEAAANMFARMHAPLLTMIKEAREENETLAATRDALLPQLMSGKLRVRDIETTMGEMV